MKTKRWKPEKFEYKGDGWELEIKYNANISYKVGNLFTLGLEARGGESGHYIGPVISHGTGKAWVAFGSAIAVTDIKNNKPQLILRMIMGINL